MGWKSSIVVPQSLQTEFMLLEIWFLPTFFLSPIDLRGFLQHHRSSCKCSRIEDFVITPEGVVAGSTHMAAHRILREQYTYHAWLVPDGDFAVVLNQ
jgi:hypothetical protein